jgi:hypothetical protein
MIARWVRRYRMYARKRYIAGLWLMLCDMRGAPDPRTPRELFEELELATFGDNEVYRNPQK